MSRSGQGLWIVYQYVVVGFGRDGMAEWSEALVRLVARFMMILHHPEVVGSSPGRPMDC